MRECQRTSHVTRYAPDPSGRAFCASLLRCAAEGLAARRFAEYLSLGQVPDATSAGTPPEAAPRSERWVHPDAELAPGRLGRGAPLNMPRRCPMCPAVGVADPGSVIGGQLRAPRRWQAPPGGRQR